MSKHAKQGRVIGRRRDQTQVGGPPAADLAYLERNGFHQVGPNRWVTGWQASDAASQRFLDSLLPGQLDELGDLAREACPICAAGRFHTGELPAHSKT